MNELITAGQGRGILAFCLAMRLASFLIGLILDLAAMFFATASVLPIQPVPLFDG